MKKQLLMAFAFLLMLGSCSQDEWQNPDSGNWGKNRIVASFEGNDTRATISDKTLLWSDEDMIAVLADGTTAQPFTLVKGAGTVRGEFGGIMPENPVGAAFPYYTEENAPALSGTTLTMTLPNTIQGIGQCNLPMWANLEGESLYFKHLGGLLAVSVNDIPSGYTSLILTASRVIAGSFRADISQPNAALLPYNNTDEANKTVTVTFDPTTDSDNSRMVYIPLPEGTYSSIKVALSDGTNELVLKNWKDKVVQRAKIYSASVNYVVIDATTPSEATIALDELLTSDGTVPEESLQVEFSDAIVADATPITVPAAASGNTSDITLSFAETPVTTEATPLVIEQDKDAVGSESVNNLTVYMTDTIEHVVINAPATSAVLNGATYTHLTATTASNTLTIGSETEIVNLTVRKGNVRIHKGGKISGSIKNASGSLVYIILDYADRIKDALPADFVEGTDFKVVYNPEYDFRQALAKGGKVVLSEFIKTNEPFYVTSPTTVDLNGQGIHVSMFDSCAFNVLPGGELTLIDAGNKAPVEWGIKADGGKVNIQGGIIRGELVAINGGTISVTGGQFNEDPSEFVADGYKAKQNTNNTMYSIHKAIVIENAALSKGLITDASLQDMITLNKDSFAVILESDAETVTNISMKYVKGITRIDQLEKFPNLQYFSCNSCDVEEIDLTFLENGKLTELQLNDNALTEMVIPANNVLKSLNVGDNSLSVLDVSHATSLATLGCRNNELTTLDLSKCTSLSSLFCYWNRMDTLDVSHNDKLTDLLCGGQKDNQPLVLNLPEELKEKWNNDWKNFGENANVFLLGEEITFTIRNKELSKALYAVLGADKVSFTADSCAVMTQTDMDAVTELIFDGYPISTLSGIENFKNLKKLLCYNNGLQEADLHLNTALDHICLHNNEVTSLDLSGLTQVKVLRLNWINWEGILDVTHMTSLEELSVAESMKLTSVKYHPDQIKTFEIGNCRFSGTWDFSGMTQVVRLGIGGTQISEAIFPETTTLKYLNVAGMTSLINDSLLVEICKKYPGLEELECYNNGLTKLDLSMFTGLKKLYCFDNHFQEVLDVSAVTTLEYLECGHSNLEETSKVILKLNDDQKALWESAWKDLWANKRVELYPENPKEEGNGSLDNFGSGGIF